MADRATNRRRGWVAAVITVIAAILVMAIGFAIPAISGASSGSDGASAGSGKATKATAAQVEATQTALTVTKVTPNQLEELTVSKYSKVSQVLLESSLSSHDKSRTESTGFSDALTYGFKASDDSSRFAELEEEIMRNPVYGVTVVRAFMDKKIGDKTIAELNPWMSELVALNESGGVAYWCEYRGNDKSTLYVTDEYRQYAASLCTFLERLVPQGVHAWETVENWPLNGAAKNNDRAGVKADYQYTKDALVLAYVGKHQDGSVAGNGLFVVGFNVHDKRPEFYGGTPDEPTPTAPPSVTPPSDNPPDNPPDDPPYNKDPSKAPSENTELNDDPTAGPSTNNGEGATTSTADQPSNSDHMTYDQYKDAIDELKEINQSQSTGNDPSTPTPSGTTVDNNDGETINQPTTSPSNDKPADGSSLTSESDGAWGGLKD